MVIDKNILCFIGTIFRAYCTASCRDIKSGSEHSERPSYQLTFGMGYYCFKSGHYFDENYIVVVITISHEIIIYNI